ncbi:MAG TPA: HAMP domain-containing sensor histidine kinase [Thermoguttaceae bacterium]|nr:HAMP domain-containing sensor histidine kinase [Thermoguttaceae bacterium]
MSIAQVAAADRLEQDHARLARQLRRVHEDMDHFVRALSHDMNANFMLLESSFGRLKKELSGASVPEVAEIVSHVDACLDQSKRFLNDLIHLARTGTVEMEPGRTELAAVVDEVLFEQDELLRGRGIRVEVRRPLPAVWYNRQRLKQIVTNLVRNAIRHGCDPRSPRIEIQALRGDDAAKNDDVYPAVRLRVHDNGPGIDPRFAEDIFLPGTRLNTAAEEGSGMGLAIVKKIAEHYGGTVRIDYGQGPGTTIEILVPGGFAVPAQSPWITHRADKHAPVPAAATPPRRRPHIRSEAHHGPH